MPVNPKLGRFELSTVTDVPDAISVRPTATCRAARAARRWISSPRWGAARPARRRRGPGARRLHVRHHRPAEGRGAPSPRGRLQPRRPRRRLGSGPATTSSPTRCRSSTSTGWCSASRPAAAGGALRHVGRFAPAAAAARSRRRDDALRRAHHVPPARRRGRAGPVDRRGLRAARLLVSGSAALPAPEPRASRGSPASGWSSATA